MSTPRSGQETVFDAIEVGGSVAPRTDVRVQLDGIDVSVDEQGEFHTAVALADVGLRNLRVVAIDAAGRSDTVDLPVTRVAATLDLQVSAPPDGAVQNTRSCMVRGRVSTNTSIDRVSLSVAGQAVVPKPDGSFVCEAAFDDGEHLLAVVAKVGTTGASVERSIRIDTQPPVLTLQGGDQQTIVEDHLTLMGTLSEASLAYVLLNGVPHVVKPKERWSVRVPLATGRHELVLRPYDSAGNVGAVVKVVVTRLEAPDWFVQLEPHHRPPLPLPIGIRFGSTAGEYQNDPDASTLCWVTSGTFVGGEPPRPTTVARGFFLGVKEVTWAQYKRFCVATGLPDVRGTFSPQDQEPVCNVPWSDASIYCSWAKGRLPDDVEWEYAARGPRSGPWPWGFEPATRQRLNAASDDDGHAYTAPVGAFLAGRASCGALDLAGNVREWVTRAAAEPLKRVARGGSWQDSVEDCQASRRFLVERGEASPTTGFRLCR